MMSTGLTQDMAGASLHESHPPRAAMRDDARIIDVATEQIGGVIAALKDDMLRVFIESEIVQLMPMVSMNSLTELKVPGSW